MLGTLCMGKRGWATTQSNNKDREFRKCEVNPESISLRTNRTPSPGVPASLRTRFLFDKCNRFFCVAQCLSVRDLMPQIIEQKECDLWILIRLDRNKIRLGESVTNYR